MDIAQSAETAIRMVREAKELVYDTEGSGLKWTENQPVGYVVGSTPQDVVYVPVRHGGGGNLPDRDVPPLTTPTDKIVISKFEKELAKAFDYRNQVGKGYVIGHHMKFDCHFSANAGIYLGRNITCTQNNAALIDEYAKKFSLDACCKRHNVTAKKGETLYEHLANMFGCGADRASMGHFWRTSGSDPLVVEYATGDGTSTMELFYEQMKIIDTENLGTVFQMESELIWTLFRMERKGIKVDLEYLERLIEYIDKRVERAFEVLPDGFNVRSPIQMRQYMEDHGYTNWPTTEKGNPSFTEKWLESCGQAGQNIITVRKWSNLSNTFARPLRDEHTVNGRVHANLNQLKGDDYGTVSGRLSCSGPNLQQIPKRDKLIAKAFRPCFISDDGFIFWEGDYSQCEPRLYAHYSEDPNLLEGYNSEPFRDVHTLVADMLKVERDPTAKRMNMGIMTGMYPKAFAGHMQWPLHRATEKWNEWFGAFPGVKDFQNDAKAVLKGRGYVRTLLGRRGRLDNPRFAYRGASKIIQGSNADILKWYMLTFDKMCEESGDIVQLLMSVHDAFEGQYQDTPYARELLEEIKNEIIQVQGPPFNLMVPFALDDGDGRNWGEATFGEYEPLEDM